MKRSLEDWLEHAESVHLKSIDLGLTRITRVGRALGVIPFGISSIIVAGTNGKGSTVAAAEALLRAHGKKTGASLSPHVSHFSERVLIDGDPASDQVLCEGFEAVEAARGEIPLTYFEYSVLVALLTFVREKVDVAVLEVGLGGRLDGFNIVDADVSVVTSIGLDHQAFLGDDLELIGAEKAGVMRAGQKVVLGADMPASVLSKAVSLGCDIARFGAEFDINDRRELQVQEGTFAYELSGTNLDAALPAHNLAVAAVACAGLTRLDGTLLDRDSVTAAFKAVRLPGRMQEIELNGRTLLLDVAHNPHGAAFLRRQLAQRALRPSAVIYGAFEDKPAEEVLAALGVASAPLFLISTHGPRGLSAQALTKRVGKGQPIGGFADAYTAACSATEPGDVILAFGSFSVVEAAHQWMSSCATG